MPACKESKQCNAGRNNVVLFLTSYCISMARVTVLYSLRANDFNTAERTMAVESHDNGLLLLADCLSNVCINTSSLVEVVTA